MKTVNKDKKTYTVNEYTTIVDKIIAEKLPPQDALVKMLEIFGNCKVINMDKGGKRGMGPVTHRSPSIANVRLKK